MSKTSISATIESETDKSVRELAKKEKRSFSQMVDLLLALAIPVFNGGEKKNKK